MSDYQTLGPFRLSLELSFQAAGDRRRCTGTANYSFAFGKVPSEQEVMEAIGECLANVRENMPDHEVALLPAGEFLNEVVLPELSGGGNYNMAVPHYCHYDDSEVQLRAEHAFISAKAAAQGTVQ